MTDDQKRGPGRPPVRGETQDARREFRLTTAEDDRLQRAAGAIGTSVSDFIRLSSAHIAGEADGVLYRGYGLTAVPIPNTSGRWLVVVRIWRTGASPVEYAKGTATSKAEAARAAMILGKRIVDGNEPRCKAP